MNNEFQADMDTWDMDLLLPVSDPIMPSTPITMGSIRNLDITLFS